MAWTPLEAYYNKFNEEKRLLARHGQVEYHTTMHFINRYLELLAQERPEDVQTPLSVIDIGAGTGRYSVALAEAGYDVTAVELVKYNLGILKQKGANVKAYQGNALKLKRFADDSFDLALLFGPMYHLHSDGEQLQALLEAKRVVRPGGIILVAYVMNDYSVIKYGFMENHISDRVKNDELTEDFQIRHDEKELYDYVRLSQIDALDEAAGLERLTIFAPDGPADYMRPVLNAMDEETFRLFLDYQLRNSERPELLGASSHTVDVLRKI
jgi:SAM-dependent methyltransferase